MIARLGYKASVAVILCAVAMTLVIVALSTKGWVHTEGTNSEVKVGVVEYTVVSTAGGARTETTRDLKGVTGFERLYEGGQAALGTGIVGILLAAVAMALVLAASLGKMSNTLNLRVLNVVLLFLAAFFVILGSFLYAAKVDLSFSFILFVGAGFVFLVAAGFLLTTAVDSARAT